MVFCHVLSFKREGLSTLPKMAAGNTHCLLCIAWHMYKPSLSVGPNSVGSVHNIHQLDERCLSFVVDRLACLAVYVLIISG